jgi:lipopolysaccharide export system permease protein
MILAGHVSRITGLAMLGATGLLWFLQVLFSYIGQLGELKEGYRALDALYYTLWEAPRYLYELLPVAGLIGAVVGLGTLASNSELVVMRAAGVSLWRIVSWVLRPALLLMVVSLALAQWVLPYASEQAEAVRTQQTPSVRLGEVNGYWTRDQRQFVYVEYANSAGLLRNIQIIQMDQAQRLQYSIRAQTGQYQQGQIWQLREGQTITVQPDGHVQKTTWPVQNISLSLQPQYVHLVTVSPENLPPSQLWDYLRYLKQQGQTAANYELALWQKLAAPFALISLVLIACSFIFGPLRQQTVGFRLVIALFVGLSFRYLQDFLGYASLVYDASVGWFVTIPIFMVVLIGAFALRRMH